MVEQQLAAPAASHIYFGARVRAALQNAQFDFPTSRRITVNLAPADLPKESGRFDLPIAIGILVATEQVPGHRLHEYEFAGELGLSGDLRPIRGALAMTLKACGDGRAFVLPSQSAGEAALVRDAAVLPARDLPPRPGASPADANSHFWVTVRAARPEGKFIETGTDPGSASYRLSAKRVQCDHILFRVTT